MLAKLVIWNGKNSKDGFLLEHFPITCTCWIKHLSHAHGNNSKRACVCKDETPYPPQCPGEFSLDAFYTSPKNCIDKLSVTCGESGSGCGENQSLPLLSPWIPAEQTNSPKQYDIYHISITLNASVSILHCPRHTPVTRHTCCWKTIMVLHCSLPSGGLIRPACA